VQTDPVFGEVARNLDAAEAALRDVEADLVVLPELFSTGYSFRDRAEAERLAEPFPDGPTVRRLLAWSRRGGAAFVAGFAERAGGRVHNAAAIVADGRPLGRYRKVHLFGFEREVFDAGDETFPVVEHRGLRVGTMVCFDWIFPESARSLALAGADVIAHPSNLVLPWCQRAMPLRALENGVYAATANRVGAEERPPRPRLRFTGGSLVVAPDGEVLASAGPDAPGVVAAEVSVARARDKRLPSGNDRLADRRPSLYRTQARSTTGEAGNQAPAGRRSETEHA
jgi:predicted amidohydrolase